MIFERAVPEWTQIRFQRIRLFILLGFGLAYVFILPPFEAPDEPAHFARAYSIAEGQVVIRDHPRDLVVFLKEAIEYNSKNL